VLSASELGRKRWNKHLKRRRKALSRDRENGGLKRFGGRGTIERKLLKAAPVPRASSEVVPDPPQTGIFQWIKNLLGI
jgi:hypothetical protein